jgi:hypothetical protein
MVYGRKTERQAEGGAPSSLHLMRGERAERARGAEQRAERRGFDGMAATEEEEGSVRERDDERKQRRAGRANLHLSAP